MAQNKPNILIILGDDIGWFNASAYNRGMMGYRTPNIDRIAKEGAMFTDWYGQQSCTAGRAAFITGQSPIRTGLTKVGLPGADIGLQAEDPTHRRVAQAARLRDRPVRQEPPRRQGRVPADRARLRRVLRQPLPPQRRGGAGEPATIRRTPSSRSSSARAACCQARRTSTGYGRSAEDRGHRPADQEAHGDGRRGVPRRRARLHRPPAQGRASRSSVWFNSTRMHIFTHLKPESQGKTGLGVYPDGMVEHDGHVGQLLEKLDDLGIADNTIVVYTTDNGAEVMTWPDGGTTPFRGEKATNWEGGFRVPMLIRWPGVIKPGTVINEIFAHEDMLPTLRGRGRRAGHRRRSC